RPRHDHEIVNRRGREDQRQQAGTGATVPRAYRDAHRKQRRRRERARELGKEELETQRQRDETHGGCVGKWTSFTYELSQVYSHQAFAIFAGEPPVCHEKKVAGTFRQKCQPPFDHWWSSHFKFGPGNRPVLERGWHFPGKGAFSALVTSPGPRLGFPRRARKSTGWRP